MREATEGAGLTHWFMASNGKREHYSRVLIGLKFVQNATTTSFSKMRNAVEPYMIFSSVLYICMDHRQDATDSLFGPAKASMWSTAKTEGRDMVLS